MIFRLRIEQTGFYRNNYISSRFFLAKSLPLGNLTSLTSFKIFNFFFRYTGYTDILCNSEISEKDSILVLLLVYSSLFSHRLKCAIRRHCLRSVDD